MKGQNKNMKNKKRKNNSQTKIKILFPKGLKKFFLGLSFLVLAFAITLAFFEKAGIFGRFLLSFFSILVGKAIYFLPVIFGFCALVFFLSPYEKFFSGLILAILISLFSLSGILDSLKPGIRYGGYFGSLFPFLARIFGVLLTQIIFILAFFFSILIFWHLLKRPEIQKEKPSLIKRIFFSPKFKITKIEPKISTLEKTKEPQKIEKEKEILPPPPTLKGYQLPPIELLEEEKGKASPGDIEQNSLIIKRTLEHFEIPVEMGKVNIGPTVTQYTLKPADGIKLSKITSLSNDLALALASHPIRIEAPIPGQSLVGVEVPNKVRSLVRLRDLISLPEFQTASSPLTFVLGRDVSGNPVFADLSRMPHLLVAGATGTGKTVLLNSLILSLLYRNSPKILNFILIDPKRVEFPVYNLLPHLLNDVIFDVQKTVSALKWLVGEMERRFDILAESESRDIFSYNKMAFSKKIDPMPFIILIIDELADLMAARGKEIEAGIVRLAQMARAVGIHLVVATQRPSVEVLTGLIKANITSRISFQVASQFDSRTVLDMAGAEKLLGRGDLLFLSAEISKPRRVQAPFVSEEEVKRVVEFIKNQNEKWKVERERVELFESYLDKDLRKALISSEEELPNFFGSAEDPLYEEAKRIVIEAKKASASLLQRRLSIGYARAARLLDMLEERGIIGPPEGSKPRKVYIEEKDEEGWKKI